MDGILFFVEGATRVCVCDAVRPADFPFLCVLFFVPLCVCVCFFSFLYDTQIHLYPVFCLSVSYPCAKAKVPLIKRFSGGGTVIVDGSTIFASLIVNQVHMYLRARTHTPPTVRRWVMSQYRVLDKYGY